MRRPSLPTIGPRRYAQVATAAVVVLGLIVLSGAAVRLTGSGLGCSEWPKCTESSFVPPMHAHSWIEYGNRLFSAVVTIVSLAAGFLAFRRRPFRRDLAILASLVVVGVLSQGVLGGLTVLFELRPEFVMGHLLLSMVVLCAAVALAHRARRTAEELERPTQDRAVTLLTRTLVPVGGIVLFAGALTTAAGPHAGSSATGEVVSRFDFRGVDTLDWLIHWHGRTGTVLGLTALAAWVLARRRGATRGLQRALTAVCLLVASQGLIGFIQYELKLPAEVVWLHVAVATATWIAILYAAAHAGRLAPSTRPAPAERHETKTAVPA